MFIYSVSASVGVDVSVSVTLSFIVCCSLIRRVQTGMSVIFIVDVIVRVRVWVNFSVNINSKNIY